MAVAWARGVASQPSIVRTAAGEGLEDHAARQLIGAPFAWAVPHGAGRGARVAQSLLRAASVGLVDHLALRSLAIDDVLAEAVRDGTRQIVILGAGLDARAYRLRALQPCTVFEVDHPASQANKVERAAPLHPLASRIVHVPVDFSHQRVEDELAQSGHDAEELSAWVCEGVTMYLPTEALRALLAAVRSRSAPGSVIALTYRSSGERPFPAPLMGLFEAALRVVGEPLRASPSPGGMAALLEEAGFAVTSDTSSIDWAPRFGGSGSLARAFRSERLVVARSLQP